MTAAVIPQGDAVRSACPHCQAELSPSEIGKLYAGLRKNKRGGRPWPAKQTPKSKLEADREVGATEPRTEG